MRDLSLKSLPDSFWEGWTTFSSNPLELAWFSFFTQASDLADAESFSIEDQDSAAMVQLIVTAPGVLKIQVPTNETFHIQRFDGYSTDFGGMVRTQFQGHPIA